MVTLVMLRGTGGDGLTNPQLWHRHRLSRAAGATSVV